ncbi:MAG: hypothetical protein NXH75_06320, partial [Halobacteriovoraceae bacterium]|nr:hypothetical protein [Halobacteriovoraceae bacterium]
YLIFPIKKNRESGLLFPSFGLNLDEGARFQQPYFWAITPHMDMTMTPSYFGNRGYGGQLEFRHVPMDGLWYQMEGLATNDTIYLPGKEDREKSGSKEFRYLGEWEHHYFNGSDINHHFSYTKSRDFDFLRDYQFYAQDKIHGPDTGLETFLELRKDLVYTGVEAGFRENQLFSETRDFDDRYVQILPKLTLGINPIPLVQSNIPGLNRISFGVDTDFTVFKQNNISELQFFRNAERVNAQPYINWNLGQFGPVAIRTKARLDYQYYRFPTQETNDWFRKNTIVYETEASITADKVFGLAYSEVIPEEKIKRKDDKKLKVVEDGLIGNLPNVSSNNDSVVVSRNSYRHRQNFKLKHYFLSDSKTDGNLNFLTQIQDDNGQFDTIDQIRSQESFSLNQTSRTSLPLSNTVEIQWNNSLIKKVARDANILQDSRGLRDNFSYDSIGFFNVSQGYDLYRKKDSLGRDLSFEEKLTRLFIETGLSVNNTSIGISEYYYYGTQENILNANITQGFGFGSIFGAVRYNSFRVPSDKFFTTGGNITVLDLVNLRASIDLDLAEKRTNQIRYGVLYSPRNNCWRLQLDYLKTIAEKRFSFNFFINFSDNNFMGLKQE